MEMEFEKLELEQPRYKQLKTCPHPAKAALERLLLCCVPHTFVKWDFQHFFILKQKLEIA